MSSFKPARERLSSPGPSTSEPESLIAPGLAESPRCAPRTAQGLAQAHQRRAPQLAEGGCGRRVLARQGYCLPVSLRCGQAPVEAGLRGRQKGNGGCCCSGGCGCGDGCGDGGDGGGAPCSTGSALGWRGPTRAAPPAKPSAKNRHEIRRGAEGSRARARAGEPRAESYSSRAAAPPSLQVRPATARASAVSPELSARAR